MSIFNCGPTELADESWYSSTPSLRNLKTVRYLTVLGQHTWKSPNPRGLYFAELAQNNKDTKGERHIFSRSAKITALQAKLIDLFVCLFVNDIDEHEISAWYGTLFCSNRPSQIQYLAFTSRHINMIRQGEPGWTLQSITEPHPPYPMWSIDVMFNVNTLAHHCEHYFHHLYQQHVNKHN